jgi:hypothetical protein
VKQIRKRLTYANVMSSIAVFLILGGAAFAAAKLPKNSVGTKQLKSNAVTSAKIKNNAVTGGKIQAGSVTGDKIAANAVGATNLADGAVTTGKIADGAVTTGKLADGAVATGKIADDAVTGAKVNENSLGQVPTANFANGAGSAQPEVFAKIEGNGSVVASLSKGLTGANVTHPSAGTYCITVPAFDARGAVANTQFGGTYGAVAQVTVGGTGFCPSPAVQVITSSTGTPNDFTFYVTLYH